MLLVGLLLAIVFFAMHLWGCWLCNTGRDEDRDQARSVVARIPGVSS